MTPTTTRTPATAGAVTNAPAEAGDVTRPPAEAGAVPRRRRVGRLASAVTATVALAAGGVVAAVPASAQTTAGVPRAAARGAAWLARQLDGRGYIRLKGKADASDTAQTVLALAATGTQSAAAHRGLRWLEAHAATSVHVKDGSRSVIDPGAAAFLILDAHALGVDPAHFGGVDLVTTLLRSERTSGRDKGLFGSAPATYDGAYRQGLSLAALAAAGVTTGSKVASAVAWLQHQQCASGGWEAYRASTTKACEARNPATYSGPDTNSTALAAEGLAAQKARLPHRVVGFLLGAQSKDGGWGYYGGASDADSTSVVLQALVALHAADLKSLRRSGGTPVRLLERDQLASGAEAFQPSSTGRKANLLATEQAVPALAGVAFPVAPIG